MTARFCTASGPLKFVLQENAVGPNGLEDRTRGVMVMVDENNHRAASLNP